MWAGVLKLPAFLVLIRVLMKQKKKNRQPINPAELGKYVALVRPSIDKIVKELGFNLVEVSFTSENQTNYLRITVLHEDRPVSTDDCEIISRSIGKKLDSLDPIPFPYILEVQSRGVVTIPYQKHEFVLEKIGLTVRS